MIKSDRWIRRMAQEHDMINPYSEKQVSEGVISYGVSSYGYDLRVADEFKIFTNVNSTIVDPKHFDERSFVTVNADVAIVPPNSFALARSVEYFKIPRDVLTICVGKSTYARCGIIVNVTPFEPEWEGFVALEISNTTPRPAKICVVYKAQSNTSPPGRTFFEFGLWMRGDRGSSGTRIREN
jgi:dCTP deaminase